LGTIRVQQGGPALTVSSPLNNGDTIASCSSPPTGITATLNPGQTVSVQASGSATAGTVTCTTTGTATLQPMDIFLPIEPGPGPPLVVTASLLSGGPNGSGNYQVEVSSDWLDEIDGVTICGSAGFCPDATSLVADGGSTATFDVNVPAVANGQSCSYNVVAEGYSGDPDDNGPVYGYGSVELCPDVSNPPPPTLQIQNSEGINLTNTNQSVMVGQYLDLYAVVLNSTATYTFQWAPPPGNAAVSWSDTASQSQGATPVPPSSLQVSNLTFAWTDTSANAQCSNAGQCLKVTATPSDGSQPLSAVVQYTLTAPQQGMPSATQLGTVIWPTCPGFHQLAMCNFGGASGGNGITFGVPGAPYYEFLQIANVKIDYITPSGAQCEQNASGRDGDGPLTVDGDAPGLALLSSDQTISASFSFSTWFMYKAASADLFVPLYRIDWFWVAQAQTSLNSPTGWQLSSATWGAPIITADSSYPTWNQTVSGGAGPPCETVTAPAMPTGTTSGAAMTSYMYTTGGSSSSLNNPVQYQFSWGDGTPLSAWLSPGADGTASASHSWTAPATYSVTAQARSATNQSLVSSTSGALPVSMH
jgi:hypothetical protein